MPEERRGPASRGTYEGGKDMETVARLEAPKRVQRLQSTLHAKAKEDLGFRFYSLCDKVWREDVLWFAWQEVRRIGGDFSRCCGCCCAEAEVRWTMRASLLTAGSASLL